ncbi:MAG: transglutaminase family protein [Betaproteobacteria bacterium]|nr:MAG: transglutaminase family protein [Betaproteobacteria bacterium]
MDRRGFIKLGTALPLGAAAGTLTGIGQSWGQQKSFAPRPGQWRTFDVTTRVEILKPAGVTRVWLPLPSIDSDYQKSLDNRWVAPDAQASVVEDGRYGAKILVVEFPASAKKPTIELTSRVQTQDRAVEWGRKSPNQADAASLKLWLQPTELMPTDGIVHRTAEAAIKGKRTDRDKAQALYDWVVTNTYREPTTRGCGVGDIKAMLESGNLGGKCADLNALFVGLARSVGIPARDVYGVRLAPSAFGYKALSANSANITRAQHCRAEVYLAEYGWTAMDPADVAKVMREETSTWIKTASHPLVARVNQRLFGSWEGNWLAFNLAHDIALPGAKGPKLGFFMYPNAETSNERLDSLDPDNFKYTMSAREVKAA